MKLLLSTAMALTLLFSAEANTASDAPVIVTKKNYPTVETSRQFVIQIRRAGGLINLIVGMVLLS